MSRPWQSAARTLFGVEAEGLRRPAPGVRYAEAAAHRSRSLAKVSIAPICCRAMSEDDGLSIEDLDTPAPSSTRHARPGANIARRETGILAAAVTAVPLLVASGITLVPELQGVWETAIGIAVLVVIVTLVAVQIVRSARTLLVGEYADTQLVAYTDNRETGILLKGEIENVSLRVSTVHSIVDALTDEIPQESRKTALYECGRAVGKSWASEFRRELPRLEIREKDVLYQLLKWSEYDATAGMGRLTVAVNPQTGEGVVTLANGFLSRASSTFPLNWWFAGYLAGTLDELLQRKTSVTVINPSINKTEMTFFQVVPESHQSLPATQEPRPIDPRTVARGKVWLKRLKTPLPDEVG